MTNEDIFKEFWKTYKWPDQKPVIYRLYYDDRGQALEYSMEDHSGNWIEITPQQYAMADMRAKVINGAITYPPPPAPPKLVPGDSGIPCHLWSMLLVVDPQQPNKKWRKNIHAY